MRRPGATKSLCSCRSAVLPVLDPEGASVSVHRQTVDVPVVPQRRACTMQTMQKVVEIPQVQSSGLVDDVPVNMQRQVQWCLRFSYRRSAGIFVVQQRRVLKVYSCAAYRSDCTECRVWWSTSLRSCSDVREFL